MVGVSPKKDTQLMFGELLTHLRQHGFPIGVDHYLRLQELLDKVGEHCAPEDLKTLLAPIFATSRSQQEQFYRAFDSYFALFEPSSLKEAPARTALQVRPKEVRRPEPQQAQSSAVAGFQKKWLYVVVPVVLLSLILGLVLLLRKRNAPNQNTVQQPNANAQPPEINANTGVPPITEVPVSPPTFEQPGTVTADIPPTGEPGTVQPVQPSAMPQPSIQPTPQPSFYQRYRTLIYLTALVVPLLIFLLYELYKRRRRRLVLQRERRRKAPYAWPVRAAAAPPKLFESEQFYTAARLLRRRQVAEFYRLDVEATVAATIDSLGYPSFRYKSASKPPEYLVLIDRASFRDHQAQLFNELTKALETEGVFVARYFYDDDPRVCRDRDGEESFHLNELQNRYGTHRLLIFGDGAKLIDQLTGKLEMWTALLMNWQDRAVLTPESPLRWGLRERALARQFVLLPATLDGLQSLVDYFEAAVTPDLRVWTRTNGANPATVDFNRPITIKMLREYLGKDVFEWLCACAIYPELHWDLTLYLGSLPSLGNNLVQEKNLLRLASLPWFRTGLMPDNLRWLLINELPPEKARAVRTSLIQLLEKNPPPKASIAEENYRLNLSAQRWLHSRSRERLRELLDLMRRLPRNVALRDQTLVRYLESAPALPLNIALPARLRKLSFQHGLPAFGLKTSARFIVTLLSVAVAWTAIFALSPKPQQPNNLSAMIANSLPAPTPELYPEYPAYPTDYTAQNQGLDPSVFPTPIDPNANAAGFPSANDFPQATEQPKVTTPAPYTPPATSGGGGFPRAPRNSPNIESKTDAATSTTPQPTPTPFPPLNKTEQSAAQQAQPAAQTEGAITPPPALTPGQLAQSQDMTQQRAPNKVSKGGQKPEDRARVAATQAFQQGEQLRAQATKELLPQVVNKFESALAAYRSAKDRAGEAAMLNNMGVVHNSMGEREKALEYYRQALTIQQELNNRAGQSTTLSNVGKIYEGVGDKAIAQEFYDQSRSVWQTDTTPDKKMKAQVSDNRQVKLLDTTTEQELRTLSGHTANVFEVAFSPDGKRLATASDDGSIRIWNALSGETQVTFTPGAAAYHLTFSADGKTITTTETDGRTKIWDATTGKLLSTTEPPAQAQQQSAPK
ncbi:MAG TPA: tetratricopeptide repeat protein [Pyrinomonadaceae bacterium]|jgi:tetratricopeptide (TPR) repeat protein